MPPNSLVFSADDFGKSKTANKNILNLVKLAKIQRVAILVNGNFGQQGTKGLLDNKVKLDIHLILPGSNYKNEQGRVLRRSFLFLAMLATGKTTLKEVERSWEEQIKKFKKIFGKYPDGLNSHEHVHFFPPYFKIALKLCKKYKIPRIRFGRESILDNNNRIGKILKIFNKLNKRSFSSYKLRVASYTFIVSLDWIGNFDKFKNNLPKGTIEIVCHPERKEEYEAIKNLS